MGVQPVDFLKFAKAIMMDYQDEIGRRNTVSRAYYAAFLQFEQHFKVLPKVKGSYGVHMELIERAKLYVSSLKHDEQEYATLSDVIADLEIIKKLRTKADCFIFKSINMREAEESVTMTEKILSELAKLGSSRPFSA